jgi:hypothetical protein
VARSWVYALVARYRAEGEAAFEPRSRRPATSPRAIPAAAVELICTLRKDLAGAVYCFKTHRMVLDLGFL